MSRGNGLVSGDRRLREIFDVTKDQMPVEKIKKLVHPDDAERFSADSEASLDPADPRRAYQAGQPLMQQ